MSEPVDVGVELIATSKLLLETIERYMEVTKMDEQRIALEQFTEQMAMVLRRSGFDEAAAIAIARQRIAEMERQQNAEGV